MPIDVKKSQKSIAQDLRRKGFSYSEIGRQLALPKSTLSLWLKNLELTIEQKARLIKKRSDTAKKNILERKKYFQTEIETVKSGAKAEIKKISTRELWLIGIMLYGKERWQDKLRQTSKLGVYFTSSDPVHIRIFLKWLRDIGGVRNEELLCDMFLKGGADEERIKRHWSDITGLGERYFTRIYLQKSYPQEVLKQRVRKKNEFGQLRIRVRGSTMLKRQLQGWMQGIEEQIFKNV